MKEESREAGLVGNAETRAPRSLPGEGGDGDDEPEGIHVEPAALSHAKRRGGRRSEKENAAGLLGVQGPREAHAPPQDGVGGPKQGGSPAAEAMRPRARAGEPDPWLESVLRVGPAEKDSSQAEA